MLTTRTLTNAGAPLYSPKGVLLAGVAIRFVLSDSGGMPTDAWDAETNERVGGDPVTVTTDAQGEFSAALWPNTRGNRATKYKCRVEHPGFREFSGVVEDVPGALTWAEFMLSGGEMAAQDMSAISAAIASHVATPDPHTQYAKESDLGAAAGLDVGTTAGSVAAGNDPRLSDSRTPTGGAGGVLSGSYPNPGFAVDMATQAELDLVSSAKVDKVAGKGLSTEDYSTAEKNKLAGVATGATANATDAQLRDRATHTGAQAISTVTGLQTALDSKQPIDADLTAIAAIAGTSGLLKKTAANTWVLDTTAYTTNTGTVTGVTGTAPIVSSGGTAPVISMAAATASVSGYMTSTYAAKLDGIAAGAQVNTVTTVAGKTGAVLLVKADVGLGNVDNTADTAKPVSTAQQTAMNLKANIASPTFTGTVNGITKSMVGLGNADNTSDASKPVSTAQAAAIATATAVHPFLLIGA